MAPERRHNDVLLAGVCSEMRFVDVAKKRKKGQKLSCVKLAICLDHPRRRSPLKFCMRGHAREIVIYFLRAVGVENRPLPLAYTTAYTTSRDYHYH